MKDIKEIMLMSNGLTAVFDQKGKQIAELQESWFRFYLEFLKEKGISGEQIEKIKINTPGGLLKYIRKDDNWKSTSVDMNVINFNVKLKTHRLKP